MSANVDANAYELRPLDTLMPDEAGLCFDALLATATARSPRRLVLFHSPPSELLVTRVFLLPTCTLCPDLSEGALLLNTVLVIVFHAFSLQLN